MKYNPNNERIKRKYFVFLKDAKGQNDASIDGVAMALTRFETYNKRKDFKAFHYEQAIAFKRHLAKQNNSTTDEKLSKATIHTILRHLKKFFEWLTMQSSYKSKLNYSDMEYFNLADNDVRVATTRREKRIPSLEQIERVIDSMPSRTPIEMRNRALIAFTLLTGARDSAIASFKLKHINIDDRSVYQDARQVKTKFAKTFRTYFFPVDEKYFEIVAEWVQYLQSDLLYGENDPLFPKTQIGLNDNKEFSPTGLINENWANANSIRTIFKKAFEEAGLKYFNPHSFRSTLVRLGEKRCMTPEEFKAWSQNLGHEQVMTTFTSYGYVGKARQAELIRLFRDSCCDDSESEIKQLVKVLASKFG